MEWLTVENDFLKLLLVLFFAIVHSIEALLVLCVQFSIQTVTIREILIASDNKSNQSEDKTCHTSDHSKNLVERIDFELARNEFIVLNHSYTQVAIVKVIRFSFE